MSGRLPPPGVETAASSGPPARDEQPRQSNKRVIKYLRRQRGETGGSADTHTESRLARGGRCDADNLKPATSCCSVTLF